MSFKTKLQGNVFMIFVRCQCKNLWAYFAIIRNLYSHSAGVVTDSVVNNMKKIKD